MTAFRSGRPPFVCAKEKVLNHLKPVGPRAETAKKVQIFVRSPQTHDKLLTQKRPLKTR